MYHNFKSSHAAQSYLNYITIKRSRDALVRLHFGISELRVGKRYESEQIVNKDCAFCPGIHEDEIYFLFQCPVSFSTRHKHTAEFMDQEGPSTLKAFLEAPLALVFRERKSSHVCLLFFNTERKTGVSKYIQDDICC